MKVSHLALESKTDSNWILCILLLLCLKGIACQMYLKCLIIYGIHIYMYIKAESYLYHSIDSLCAWKWVKSTVSVDSRVFGLNLWGGGKYFRMFSYIQICPSAVDLIIFLWYMHTCHNIVQKQRQCIVGAHETHSLRGIVVKKSENPQLIIFPFRI